MLGPFLDWWGGELRGMLPGGAAASAGRGPRLLLAVERERVEAMLIEAGGSRALGGCGLGDEARAGAERQSLVARLRSLDPTATRVEVGVAPLLTLVNDLAMPAAAAENLREAVGFQVEQVSPFRADDIYFEHALLPGGVRGAVDGEGGTLGVRLAMTRRRAVDEALSLLHDWALEQQPLGEAPAPGDGLTLAFRSARYREHRGRGLSVLLGLVVLALLAACVVLPLRQQAARAEQLEAELATVRREAAVTASLQEQLSATQDRLTAVREEAVQRPPRVLLLEEVTRLLPDHTALSRLELRGARLDLRGTSTASSALIGLLEASPMFQSVSFGSPVVADRGGGGERFHLTATIVGRAPARAPS